MAFRRLLLLASLFLILSSCRIVSISTVSSPIICFTFDDLHEGVYRVALPLMEQYGYRGTCFVNTARLGSPTLLTQEELLALHHQYHWEIGGHTLKHEDLTNLSYTEARNTISADFQNLQTWNLEPRSFALPCGDCPLEYYSILTSLYRNIRGSNDLAMHVPLNRLGLGYLAYQSSWNASVIKERIQRGIADNEDLIIIGFHQIDMPADPWGCNCETETFRAIVEYVQQLGLEVLPLDEAVEKLDRL